MPQVETVKVKRDNDQGYHLINASDYDPKVHKLVDKTEEDKVKAGGLTEDEQKVFDELSAKRRANAEYGQTGTGTIDPLAASKNPSGTFSEPTPTNIQYPNKDHTEFENNHGAFVNKSAAGLREERGLPDAPGGVRPVAGMRAEHRGAGRYAIMNGEEEFYEPLKKAEAKEFNEMSDEDKTRFIAERRDANAPGGATQPLGTGAANPAPNKPAA